MGRSTASRRHRPGPLAVAAGLAALYLSFAATGLPLSGGRWWDGVLGVVLGLFICSIPVRHFLDMIIYWRVEAPRFASRRALSLWVAVNGCVLAAGWLVIVVGATRFTTAP